MSNSESPTQPTIEVDNSTLFGGAVVKNVENGTWNIHIAPGAAIYLHNTVGIEAAMKLFVWEDAQVDSQAGRIQVKTTSNQHGRVVGVVVRSY